MKSKTLLLGAVVTVLVLLLALSACTSSTPPAAEATATLSSGEATADGATLLQERCTQCHGLDKVKNEQLSPERWETIVQQMINRGAKLNADEQKVLVDYLAETYGQ